MISLTSSGVTWQDKIETLRAELIKLEMDALVLTALDEVAWLLNIRGSDIPNEPVLLSYMYISANQTILFAESSKINTSNLINHLNGVE